jgi:hypothetical protein
MRHLTALLVLVSSTALAQERPVKTAPSPAKAVLQLEDGWARALVKRDRATFERILAPKFVYSEDTVTMDRATTMQGLVGGDVVTESHNEKMEAHVYGETIVITGWLIVNGHNKNGQFHHRYRFTDVWIPKGSSFQIVAAHDVLVNGK